MEYAAGILGGIAASAVFWLIDKYVLSLPQSYQLGGVVACFVVFGATGFWLASRGLNLSAGSSGARIASELRGRNVRVKVDGVRTDGHANTDVLSDVNAKGDIDAEAKNIQIEP